MPAPLLPTGQLDYTGLERESMLLRAQRLFNQVNPNHEDFSSNFPENLLLEGAVTLIDMIRAVMEQRVRQCYWATVTERRAAARLGRMSWFNLTGASASTVDLLFTSNSALTTAREVTIPAGTRIRSIDPNAPLTYYTIAAATKAAAAASISVACENADAHQEQFASTGAPNQEYTTPLEPYVEASAVLTDNTGSFELITSFLGLKGDGTVVGPADRCAVLTMDDQNRLVVRFGDGITGAIPQGTVTLDYKIGGGSLGAVDQDVTWQLESTILDSVGSPANFLVTNPAPAVPGVDPMTTAEAKVLGPLSMRTIKRCVNTDDFEYVARLAPGIARAACINASRDSSIGENTAILFLVAYGEQYASGMYAPAAPTQAQIALVAAKIAQDGTHPALMGVRISVHSAYFLNIAIDVRIHVDTEHYTPSQARAGVLAAVRDLFAVAYADKSENPWTQFGYALRSIGTGSNDRVFDWSTVFGAVLLATGVRAIPYGSGSLLINGVASSLVVEADRFPLITTIIVRNEDAGGAEITS